jgi:hypothetical protein
MKSTSRRSPVPVEVEDLASLARLVSTRADYIAPLLAYLNEDKHIISHTFSIPFGRYSIPLLLYMELKEPPKAYLVYTPLEHEETWFSHTPESGRYISFPVVEAFPAPDIIEKALTMPPRRKIVGLVSVRLKNMESLMRMVSALTDEASSPPLWCFANRGKYVAGIFYPVFEYYDSAALPILYYVELDKKPTAPFTGYRPTTSGGVVEYTYSISDARYVYGRIVYLKSFPFQI